MTHALLRAASSLRTPDLAPAFRPVHESSLTHFEVDSAPRRNDFFVERTLSLPRRDSSRRCCCGYAAPWGGRFSLSVSAHAPFMPKLKRAPPRTRNLAQPEFRRHQEFGVSTRRLCAPWRRASAGVPTRHAKVRAPHLPVRECEVILAWGTAGTDRARHWRKFTSGTGPVSLNKNFGRGSTQIRALRHSVAPPILILPWPEHRTGLHACSRNARLRLAKAVRVNREGVLSHILRFRRG